jgi:hypothetical protein
MRLFEITQQITEVTAFQERKLMDNDWKNPREVKNWLFSKNFEQKGSGQFSVALVHPGYKRIVKISKKQDECWLRFAHWTLKMTSHPNVPYIDWVRRYGEDDKFFIAVVEKLAPFNRQAIMNTVDLPGLAYLYLYEDWFSEDNQIINRLKKEGIIQDDTKLRPARGGQKTRHIRELGKTSYKPQVRKWLKTVKGGKRFINVIRSSKKFARGKCAYDMHDGNLMYRPTDRRLVVIDPLADLNQANWF